MDSLIEELLSYYGIPEKEAASFMAEPSFSSIPLLNEDFASKKAKERVEKAIKDNEKILIYGDYDTDGIMAVSILVYALKKLGGDPSFFIPSRYKDGYGLNKENAEKIANASYDLVILADNGVSCYEEVSYLLSKGIDTLIIDHHELPSILPPSYSLIHPDTLHYGEHNVSAGYLCFLFSYLLLGEKDGYLLTLGALSTISDMMPIKEYNRTIVALSLREIRKNKYPTIVSLTNKRRIDEYVLSMEVVPCINAVGRIEEGHELSRLVTYFSSPYDSSNLPIAIWMKEKNEERKTLTRDASASIAYEGDEAAIVVLSSLKEGLNGLLANRIMMEKNKPTAVFSPSNGDPNVYVGSFRAKEGLSLVDAFSYLSPYFLKSGGHEHAGGASISKERFESFKKDFIAYCSSHPFVEKKEKSIPISLDKANMETFSLIRKFAPFGKDHEAPKFLLKDIDSSKLTYVGKDRQYLSTRLDNGAKLFSFSLGEKDLKDLGRVSLLISFAMEEYKGNLTLTLLAQKKED